MTRLLTYPTKSIGFSEINNMQRAGDLPATYWTDVQTTITDADGLGNYYYAMAAYRLLHQLPIYDSFNTLLLIATLN